MSHGPRRWLAAWLALFAVLLQVNAPVRSTLMTVAAGDAFAICSVQTGADQIHAERDGKGAPAQHHTCADCVICHLASPTPTPVAIVVPPPAQVAEIAPIALRRDHAPRAPPVFAPRARGPPEIA